MPRFFLGSVFTTIRERFVDSFVRSNRADLGTASDGSLWSNIRSGFRLENNRAVATNHEQYPIATIDMPFNDVTINLTGVTPGGGAAIWVQSSDDWWAVTATEKIVDVPASTRNESGNYQYSISAPSYSYSGVSSYNYTVRGGGNAFTGYASYSYLSSKTGSYTASGNYKYKTSYTVSNLYPVSYNQAYQGTSGIAYYKVQYSYRIFETFYYTTTASYNYKVSYNYLSPTSGTYAYTAYNATWQYLTSSSFSWTAFVPGYSYTAFAPYTYTVVVPATTAVQEDVNVLRSIAGVVSTVTSWAVSTVQTVRSLRVRLSGNTINVTPFSDGNLVNQVGSTLVYTATGAEVTPPRFGLTISPSTYGQGTTAASSINITR